MIDKKAWEQVNGFSTKYHNLLESIEFCLKMGKSGKQIVLNPIVAIQVTKLNMADKPSQEQAEEFMKKWNENYEKADPFFSPNLSNTDTGLSFQIR